MSEKTFEAALDQARRDQKPVMALRREPDDTLDDVVVQHPNMFRAEMMSEASLWMACYFANGDEVTFNVRAECRPRRLVFESGELPGEWLDWDELRRSSMAASS